MLNTLKISQNKRFLIFVAAFALTAVLFLLAQILAASDVAVFEAEDAVATEFADISPDQAASNGEFIQFGDLSIPPDPDPDPEPDPDPTPGDVLFFEDFVDPASIDRFETITWHRDPYLGGGSMEGDHAPVSGGIDPNKCTNPFSTRTLSHAGSSLIKRPSEHVYRCAPGDDGDKAHMMTAQGPQSGYDFTAAWTKESFSNITEVQWDQNITDLGGRNWSEIKIVPLRTWDPIQPPCGIEWVPCWTLAEGGTGGDVRTHAEIGSVGLNWFNGSPLLVSQLDEEGEGWYFRSDWSGSIHDLMETRYQAFSSPAPRFTHRLVDHGNGTISMFIDTKTEEYGWFELGPIAGGFPDEPSIIVLSTHDYTSGKSSGLFGGKTWHWDDIIVK